MGLRPRHTDGAHGIHQYSLRRAAAPGVHRSLQADEGHRDRFSPESKYFVRSIQYKSSIRTWLENTFYRPLFDLARPLAGTGRLIQSGSLHVYVAYIVAALLLLLLLARWL